MRGGAVKTKEEKRAYRNALYQSRKLAGVCIECRAVLQEDDGLRCVECTERASDARKRYRATKAGREKERAAHKRAFDQRRASGLCGHCHEPAMPGRAACAGHLAYHRKKSLEWVRAKRAGIVPIKRKPVIPRIPGRLVEGKGYLPVDEMESRPRVRIVRALAFVEWISFEDLRVILNVPSWDENDPHEYDAYSQMVSRLTKRGVLERRKVMSITLRTDACFEYRLSDKGREELARYRSGDLVRKQRRAA